MMYMRAMESLRTLRDNEEGQGLVEYGLILGLISVLAIAALTLIGQDVQKALEDVAAAL